MDDGSRSGCQADVSDAAACEALRAAGKWSRCHFVSPSEGQRCACEGEIGQAGASLNALYEPDADDLDRDGDFEEMVRWHYVVVVDRCEVAAGRCRERHRLIRGWTDDKYR